MRSAIAAFLVLLASSVFAQEKRVALIIGNDAYTGLPKLNNAVADARAMDKKLKELGFQTTLRTNVGRVALNRALSDFATAIGGKAETVGLVFYAGHGIQAMERNWLIPVDAQLESDIDLEAEAVDAQRFLKAMDEARNTLNIVILDACRDNPLPKRQRSAERGLAIMSVAPRGSVIAYSASPNQKAQDGTPGGNGVYTGELLKALDEPGLKIEDVFKRANGGVQRATGGRQVPWFNASIQGDFYFRPGGGGTVVAPPVSLPPVASLPSKPELAIVPIERDHYAYGTARVREAPDVRSKQVAALKDGQRVMVLGKVKDQDWYLIEQGSKPAGYVAISLLVDEARYRELKEKEEDAARRDALARKAAEEERQKQAAALISRPPPSRDPQALSVQPAVGTYDLQPGQVFRDCQDCPEMVVIPAGSFVMGLPAHEQGRGNAGGPQRNVSIRSFALGKTEVTFAQYDACTANNACPRAADEGWGRGDRPVINVSWNDAKQYIAWLSRKTGKGYRLPSEAEWEYAARAGTTTRFSCGNDDGCLNSVAWISGNSGGRTQPVGGKLANAFGLHDMHGNVWEWVEDCYNRNYNGAPTDGSAWLQGECGSRGLRGGSWNFVPLAARSAHRDSLNSDTRNSIFGFRLARTN